MKEKELTQIHKVQCYNCRKIVGFMAWDRDISFYSTDSTNRYPNITQIIISNPTMEGRFVCPKCYEKITGEKG